MLAATPYLRVILTKRCPLRCPYCHGEGQARRARVEEMGHDMLVGLLDVGVELGVRKLKLLGGEPLSRADLPLVVGDLRASHPTLDLSLITAGVAPLERMAACFDAGLSRANLSIHGFGLEAFMARSGSGRSAWERRGAMLELLRREGRFLKLNYVYRGRGDDADLAALLDAAASWEVVVNVLDELGEQDLGPASLLAALGRIREAPLRQWEEPDPCSLPTLHLAWADGLEVEIKDHHLGEVAPWRACASCPGRGRCREGIVAQRLTPEGRLLPCMDRPDLAVDLAEAWRAGGRHGARRAWLDALEAWSPERRVA